MTGVQTCALPICDLDDPWGFPSEAYERAAREIDAVIPGLLADLHTRIGTLSDAQEP